MNLNASQRQKSSSEILKDIYENLVEGFNEFGLAEFTYKSDFGSKIFPLKEKWESLSPGFHNWFKRTRSDDFVASVIQSIWEETNVQVGWKLFPKIKAMLLGNI